MIAASPAPCSDRNTGAISMAEQWEVRVAERVVFVAHSEREAVAAALAQTVACEIVHVGHEHDVVEMDGFEAWDCVPGVSP